METREYGHKPHKPIDWEKVDRLIEAQNKAVEIAGHFGLSDERFCERLKEKYGITFTAYSAAIYSKGKSNLRTRQYQKAMEGNVQLLIRLGEVYLDQAKAKGDNDAVLELENTFASLMNQIKSCQSRDLKNEDSQTINESKS